MLLHLAWRCAQAADEVPGLLEVPPEPTRMVVPGLRGRGVSRDAPRRPLPPRRPPALRSVVGTDGLQSHAARTVRANHPRYRPASSLAGCVPWPSLALATTPPGAPNGLRGAGACSDTRAKRTDRDRSQPAPTEAGVSRDATDAAPDRSCRLPALAAHASQSSSRHETSGDGEGVPPPAAHRERGHPQDRRPQTSPLPRRIISPMGHCSMASASTPMAVLPTGPRRRASQIECVSVDEYLMCTDLMSLAAGRGACI